MKVVRAGEDGKTGSAAKTLGARNTGPCVSSASAVSAGDANFRRGGGFPMVVAMNVRAAGKTLVFQYLGGLAFLPGGARESEKEGKISVWFQFGTRIIVQRNHPACRFTAMVKDRKPRQQAWKRVNEAHSICVRERGQRRVLGTRYCHNSLAGGSSVS